MITKEPSEQVTPLPTEPAGFPEPVLRPDLQPPPVQHAWEVLKAFLVWVASVVLLLIVPVIVALPYIAYNWTKHGPPRPEDLATDKTLLFLSIIGVLPTHLLTIALVWAVVTHMGRRPFSSMSGLRWPKHFTPWITVGLAVLLAFVLLAIGWAVTQVLGGSKTQLDLLVESSLPARFATAFVAVFTAPLAEELIYRGVLYSALERATGMAVAVGVVSLLFAGVHVFQYWNNLGVITVITLLSFTLTLARAYSGSLFPPLIIHLVFNGIQALVLALAPFIDSNLLEKGEKVTPTTPGLELVGQLLGYLCHMT